MRESSVRIVEEGRPAPFASIGEAELAHAITLIHAGWLIGAPRLREEGARCREVAAILSGRTHSIKTKHQADETFG